MVHELIHVGTLVIAIFLAAWVLHRIWRQKRKTLKGRSAKSITAILLIMVVMLFLMSQAFGRGRAGLNRQDKEGREAAAEQLRQSVASSTGVAIILKWEDSSGTLVLSDGSTDLRVCIAEPTAGAQFDHALDLIYSGLFGAGQRRQMMMHSYDKRLPPALTQFIATACTRHAIDLIPDANVVEPEG